MLEKVPSPVPEKQPLLVFDVHVEQFSYTQERKTALTVVNWHNRRAWRQKQEKQKGTSLTIANKGVNGLDAHKNLSLYTNSETRV